MSWQTMLRSAQKFALQNSPTILTAVGALGVVTTSVMAARAGYSSALLLSEAKNNRPQMQGEDLEPLTKRETVELVWKQFIPPAVIGAITLIAIVGANRIGTRRATALAAGFAISERMADEYRQKVVEHMGAQKEEMVRSDVARDRIGKSGETIVLGAGEILFYDSWSARAFSATRQEVENAVNQINYQINQSWAMSLSEFYDLLNLPKTAVSDDFGWNSDTLLVLHYTSTLLPDGRPACEIRYEVEPFQNFNKIG